MPSPNKNIIKNRPKSQSEALFDSIEPKDPTRGKEPISAFNRGNEVSMRGDTLKDFSILFEDVDAALLNYFNEKIKPYVIEDGNVVPVPVMFTTPERWKAAQLDGGLRDKNGKIMFPVIVLTKNTIVKNRTLGNKLDGNNAHNVQVFEKRYSSKNIYDNFAVLNNRIPVKEFGIITVPDYYTITYSCAIYTSYVEDLNNIIQEIGFASDSYWGDPDKFMFEARIDSFQTTQELTQQDVRKVYSIFDLSLKAQIIPDSKLRNSAANKKFLSKAQIVFTAEIAGSLEEFEVRAKNKKGGPNFPIFPEKVIVYNTTIDNATSVYLDANYEHQAMSSDILPDRFTIRNVSILPAPGDLPPTSKDNFFVFVNGQYVDKNAILSIEEDGDDVLVVANPDNLSFSWSSTDVIVIKGKFNQ